MDGKSMDGKSMDGKSIHSMMHWITQVDAELRQSNGQWIHRFEHSIWKRMETLRFRPYQRTADESIRLYKRNGVWRFNGPMHGASDMRSNQRIAAWRFN